MRLASDSSAKPHKRSHCMGCHCGRFRNLRNTFCPACSPCSRSVKRVMKCISEHHLNPCQLPLLVIKKVFTQMRHVHTKEFICLLIKISFLKCSYLSLCSRSSAGAYGIVECQSVADVSHLVSLLIRILLPFRKVQI